MTTDSTAATLAAWLDAIRFPAALVDDRGSVLVANRDATRSGIHPDASLFELFGGAPGAAEARDRFRDGVLRGVLDDAVLVEPAPGDAAGPDPTRVHMRSLPVGESAFALIVLEPLAGEATVERRIDRLRTRLAAIGPIKHGIGNPLMGIVGYADLLRQRLEDPDQLRLVDGIVEQCRRIEDGLERLDVVRHGDDADDD